MPLNRSTEPQAPTSPADQTLYITREPGWMQGIPTQLRPLDPASDMGIMALLLSIVVLVCLNMRHVRRIFHTITNDLFQVRRRSNAFDDHTAYETRTIILLLMQLFLFSGILMFLWLGIPATHPRTQLSSPVALLSVLAMAYYLFQLTMCTLIGYVFTDPTGAVQWRRGLNASAVLLGMCLAVPTLLSLFYPSVTTAMLWAACVLFIISRIIYIYKGFRIFYINFPSLLYFILYLCSVEIVPLIAVYTAALEITNHY